MTPEQLLLDSAKRRLPQGTHVKTQGVVLMVGELEALIASAEEAVRLRGLVKTKQQIIDSQRTIIERHEDSPIKLELDRMSIEVEKYRAVVEAIRRDLKLIVDAEMLPDGDHVTVPVRLWAEDRLTALDALDKTP